MKFLHLADLHLGKRISDYDLSEVQQDILHKLIDYVVSKDIDTIVVSGDIYDSHDPSATATALLDDFMSLAHKNNINLLMISGNHDQEDKLHFGSNILKNDGIYIVTDIKGALTPITIHDVNFYLLPFINKYYVRNFFQDEAKDIDTLKDAVSLVISKMNINRSKKNVIVSHQAVLGSAGKTYVSGSEAIIDKEVDGSIGGEDIIPSCVYDGFDYVALGHIHKAMNVEKNIRYPGALLKYHKDEANNRKSFTIVNTEDFSIEQVDIKPLRDVVLLKGKFEEVKKHPEYRNDYVFFELTDEENLYEPMAKLKKIYPFASGINLLRKVSSRISEEIPYENIEEITKFDLFNELYKEMTKEEMDDEQKQIIEEIIKEVWEEAE